MSPAEDGGVVEFGSARSRSARWIERVFGGGAAVGPGARQLGPAAACAIIAAACLLAAELLPWMTVDALANASTNARFLSGSGPDFSIEQVGGVQLIGYYLGWLVLAALLGLALVAERRRRPQVIAVGLSVATVLLIVVAGLTRRTLEGGDQFGNAQLATAPGPGVYFGFAAIVVAAVGIGLTGWRPVQGRRPDADLDPEAEPGPADLTVTADLPANRLTVRD